MPAATYEELLAEVLPVRIETDEEYDRLAARFGELMVRRSRTKSEGRLMDLLGVLIQDYDHRHSMPPDDSTPVELLQFLLEHSGKTPADLLPVFGQRSHVHEALNNKRAINATQARKLGEMFHVKPRLFL